MAVIISLLRGVNLGGNKLVRMEVLRGMYESLGFRDVRTYLQSGNVVFRTASRNLARLAPQIENEIERKCGFHSDVILRSASDLAETIARNPLAHRHGINPSRLVVTFLRDCPSTEIRAALAGISCHPEELYVETRELYTYFPNGFAQSKLRVMMEKALKKTGTARNWNTVTNLLALAKEMEGSGRTRSGAKRS